MFNTVGIGKERVEMSGNFCFRVSLNPFTISKVGLAAVKNGASVIKVSRRVS